MSNYKDYDVSLISVGVINTELHFGPFSYCWWVTCNKETEFLVPIRLHMKTMTFLKGYNFTITVVKGNKEHSECPGYLCDCGEFYTDEPSNSSTNAISTVYQKMFRNKTKFSGPLIMGFDKPAIYEKLLEGVLFRPYFVDLELIRVFVFGIAKSKNNQWGYAGVGFKSSFLFQLEKQRCLFLQEFEDDTCKVTIMQKTQIKKIYYESTPDLVWEKVFSEQLKSVKLVELMKFTGRILYGIENNLSQELIHATSFCSLNEWDNDIIIEEIFSYYLKRRTSSHVDWRNFLDKWREQGTIIELHSNLKQLYPINHQLSEHELNAWRMILRNIGCHNITPFLKQESKYEFWTRSPHPNIEQNALKQLHELGFLLKQPMDSYDPSENFWSCFQKSLTVNKKGINGKQRILSIIADDFKYDELHNRLLVSNDLISRARKHCRLYGPGNSSMKKPSFTREKLSIEKIQEFENFISDKAHVIMSSYKTDSKTGAPVKYLRDTKQTLWEKFHAEFPDGIRRTTFMTKLQGNEYVYREDLGGLCSTCSRYGYEIFDDIRKLIESKITDTSIKNQFLNDLEKLQRFLKRDYEKNLDISDKGTTKHNSCISYCLLWAFGVCTEQHTHASQECAKLFTFFRHLKNQFSMDLHEDLDEYQNHLLYFLAHQARKVYLNAQFNANLLELDENGAVLVVDYKMKILPKSSRETKAEFFGKKGWTLHSILMYTKKLESQKLDIHAYDHWSMDARQDSWFTASSLHAVIESLENKPKWVIIISDNGPHYHNADLMMVLGHWLEWYQINVKKWVFLEAGEAKTTIDSHHAQITHAIKRQVRLGLDIMEGVDIETAIREIQGTSVAHLEPNRTRDQNKKAKNTLPGNSNLFEWSWPGDGPMEGYILGREIPNIGEWTQFSPAQIANLQKNKIEIPKPTVSAHTVPKSQWIVSMPNTSSIDPKRLTKEQLLLELTKRKINVVKTAKRDELIRELELAINNDIEVIQDTSGASEEKESANIICYSFQDFPLKSGWALKSKQKYGKRGGGKRLSKKVWKILEEYFLEGDVDKSKRYTATTMLESLKKKVEEGELGDDEIPKLQTVKNWISRYSAQHRQKMANIM